MAEESNDIDRNHTMTREVIRKEEQRVELNNGVLWVEEVDVSIEPGNEYECDCGETFRKPEDARDHLLQQRD